MPEPIPACEAWHQHLAGWVVAQLTPADEAALVAHLKGCEACRVEADGLLAVAAVALGADPGAVPWRPAVDEEPPPDLGDRIVERVASERRRHRIRRASIAVGAAATVLLAVAVVRPDRDPPMAGQRVEFVRVAPGVDADAVVAPDAGGSVVELRASGLDPDVTYALWLTPPGGDYPDRVPAGTFRPDADGTVSVRLRSALPPDEMGRVWATTPDREIALDTEPA
jgi:hypothetical protein